MQQVTCKEFISLSMNTPIRALQRYERLLLSYFLSLFFVLDRLTIHEVLFPWRHCPSTLQVHTLKTEA